MHFLGSFEVKRLEQLLRRQMAGRPMLVLHYDSGRCDYAAAAGAIAASIGVFTSVTMLFLFCVTGDGWSEGTADERWTRYRHWRAANGETRRLYDAPGHLFEAHEARQLSEAIAFSLELGWDALLSATPGRQLMALSHDDRIEVHRGFGGRSLADPLLALGCRRR
jgi:hypothetical protein